MNKKKLLACLSVLLAATVAFLAYRSRAQAVTIRSWAPSSVITAGSFIDSVNSGFYLDPAASVTSLVIAGNLGIGATPSAAIGFEGESSRTIQIERRTSANTLGKALIIRAGGAASGATNKAGGDLYLLGGTSTGTGTSNIQFQTASAGVSGTTDNTPTTKMIILGSGSVGVGTDNPSGLFAVGSSNQFQVDNNGNITATGATGLSLTGTSGGGDPSIIFGAVAGGPNKITTSGTTNLAIMPGGNVGIGTTAPGKLLHVYNSSGTAPAEVRIEGTSGYGGGVATVLGQNTINGTLGYLSMYRQDGTELARVSGVNSEAAGAGQIRFYTTPNGGSITQQMVVDSTGNVGIGTTNPGAGASAPARLDVRASTAPAYALIAYSDTAGRIAHFVTSDWVNTVAGTRLQFGSRAGTGNTSMQLQVETAGGNSNGDLLLNPNGGNVGIGTTTPVGKLEVSGAVTGKALGIFNETGDQNILVASASGTNRFVITNAGNVGIGTTAPGAKLEAVRSDSLVTAKFVQNGGWAETNFALQTTGYSSLGGLRINGADTNNTIMQTSAIGINTGGSGSALALQAGSGNVGIGTTTPGSKLDVLAGVIAVTRASGDTNSATIRLDQNNATTGGNYILTARNTGEFAVYDADTGGDFLYINTSGNVGVKALASATSNSLCYSTTAISGMYTFSTCSSSERYKKNITDFAHGMDYVEKLRPVSFNWKETGKPGVGLIAEEVAAVDPRLVTYTSDGQVEGVRYGELTTVLINALKESRKEIEDLRARVEALE